MGFSARCSPSMADDALYQAVQSRNVAATNVMRPIAAALITPRLAAPIVMSVRVDAGIGGPTS